MESTTRELHLFRETCKYLRKSKKLKLPRLQEDEAELRVFKVHFQRSNKGCNPPPDPMLLLLKAATVFSARQGEKLQPVYCPPDFECSDCDIAETLHTECHRQVFPSRSLPVLLTASGALTCGH